MNKPEPVSEMRSSETKHSAVAKILRAEIASGLWPVGSKLPSEQELAKRFQVAYMTARQAVSSLVATGEVERKPRKGTFVSDGLANQPTPPANQFVLLLQGASTSLDPYYLPPIVEALQAEIQSHGCELAIYDYKVAVQGGMLPKSVVVCCVLLSEVEVLYANLLRERGNPVLAINRCVSGERVPYVAPDNTGGAEMAVEHLIGLGHRKIGFVRGLPGNMDATDRRRGYVQTMRRHNLPLGPEEGDHFIETCGYESAKKMMVLPDPPTAIFCAGDLSAIGAMKAITELGLSVPKDVSIVGFGDFPLARYWHPDLTTVRLPLNALGTVAGKELLQIYDGKRGESTLLPCELIVRSTTSPLQATLVASE